MNTLFFWQEWQSPFKLIFTILLIVFLILCMAVPVLHMMGAEHLIEWHVFTSESSFASNFSDFAIGPLNFSLTGYKSILTEEYGGGSMPTTDWAAQILLAIFSFSLLLYLALVTIFKRFWYLVAMGGLLAFLIFMHIESVQLFGWTGSKSLILVFVLFLTPSYYLHAFYTDASFIKRLWIMSLPIFVLAIIIYFYSTSGHPFSTLMHFGVLAPYLLIILFIITIAHEIVALFINVITSTDGIGNGVKIRHFIIITLIYLANILISYLYIAHYIDWQLIYINPFLLLVISAILGVWGSSSRASLYAGASSHMSIWPILYLVIGIISLATLSFFLLSLNDPLIKVIGDVIIYAHLAVGVAFLLYILYNFIPLIETGYEIKKIIYNPTNLPFLTFRLMSIMIIVGLFAIRGFDYPVWYSLGGYDNAKADLMITRGLPEVAEAYYSTGASYAFHNHKSYYSLAQMALETDSKKASEYFGRVIDQRVSAQSILNSANLQNLDRDYYKALFTLQKGYPTLKGNDHLLNNLAVQFEILKLPDSALYYYLIAGLDNDEIKNNRLALSAKYSIPLVEDSVKLFRNLDRAGTANALALGYQTSLVRIENADHMYDMVFLNNWLLTNNPKVADGSIKLVRAIIDSTTNQEYKDQLLFSWSLAAYKAGKVAQAIEGLYHLSFNSTKWKEQSVNALVLIFLGEGAYDRATDILASLDNEELTLNEAVAFLENGYPAEAEPFWTKVANGEDKFLGTLAKDLKAAVFTDEPKLDTDFRKYLHVRYGRFHNDFYDEVVLLKELKSDDLSVDLGLDLAKFYHDQGNDSGAAAMLDLVGGKKLKMSQLRRFIILNALSNQKSENVQVQLELFDSLFSFNHNEYLLESTLNHLAGMQLDSISYLQMANDNYFFVDAVLLGAKHFDNDIDPFKSYTFLATATRNNPGSPVLLEAYIFKALEVGQQDFAQDALYSYNQRFSGAAYQRLKEGFDKEVYKIDSLLDIELN